jgi:DNA-binding response OmpR family regulator
LLNGVNLLTSGNNMIKGCWVGPRAAVVVEDDLDCRDAVQLICSAAGFKVIPAGTGNDGIRAVLLHRPEIVLLDVGLPDIDGFEVARQIREFSDTRIMMLTARTEGADILTGLGTGADDYVTKPFSPHELRHRLDALMRRPWTEDLPGTDRDLGVGEPVWTVLEHQGLQLTEQTRTVTVDGPPVYLTRVEFDLLHALMESPWRVFSHADLASIIYRRPAPNLKLDAGAKTAVRDHIGRLRRKLGETSRVPRWVETVPGYGYRMTAAQLPDQPGQQNRRPEKCR